MHVTHACFFLDDDYVEVSLLNGFFYSTTAVELLESLGKFLHTVMNNNTTTANNVTSEEVEPPRANAGIRFQSQSSGFAPDTAPSFILTTDPLNCVTTLYAHRGHPPEVVSPLFLSAKHQLIGVQHLYPFLMRKRLPTVPLIRGCLLENEKNMNVVN